LLSGALLLEPRTATDDELALVHELRYIELVEREVSQNRGQLSTGDTASTVNLPKPQEMPWDVH